MTNTYAKMLVVSGTVLFVTAAVVDLALRAAYAWVDTFAEVLVGVAVSLLIAGWAIERALGRHAGCFTASRHDGSGQEREQLSR